MPLYSSEPSPAPAQAQEPTWSYVFVHSTRTGVVEEKLRSEFTTFVHRTVIYRREPGKRPQPTERPTVSGLIFIQGAPARIQQFLNDNFAGIRLVNDRITRRPAMISHAEMVPFMRVSQLNANSIRFMPRPFSHYAEGHTLVRITSGPLAGMEGYRLRISRDKCLITSIGGMTISIGGIHRESFENIDEYVRQRREAMLRERSAALSPQLTPAQQRIDEALFTPEDEMDVLALTDQAERIVAVVEAELAAKDFDGMAETGLYFLATLGRILRQVRVRFSPHTLRPLGEAHGRVMELLAALTASEDVAADLKAVIATRLGEIN